MITDLIQAGLGIIEKVIPDKKAQDEAKLKFLELEKNGEMAFYKAYTEVTTAELKNKKKGQLHFRELFMFLFMIIIANDYLIEPIVKIFWPVYSMPVMPPKFWTLIELSVGINMMGMAGSQIAKNFKKN